MKLIVIILCLRYKRDNFSEKFIEIINYSGKLTKNNTGLKLM